MTPYGLVETPRTDALIEKHIQNFHRWDQALNDQYIEVRTHAEQLERELADAARLREEATDWNALFQAVTMGGLPDAFNIPNLWPNSWHQDCAAVAFMFKGLTERADKAEHELQQRLTELDHCREAAGRTEDAERELAEARAEKDGAYLERNQVVAALSKCFPACVTKTVIEGWSEDWHGCVYIMLPAGQVSWHFHDSQAYLFAHLPVYDGQKWDGHDTPEKYRRLAALAEQGAQGGDHG